VFCLALLTLAACSPPPSTAAQETSSLPAPEQPSATLSAPVALVNGEAISSDSYNLSLAQYQAARQEFGTLLATEDEQETVLEELISRILLAQGARAQG